MCDLGIEDNVHEYGNFYTQRLRRLAGKMRHKGYTQSYDVR